MPRRRKNGSGGLGAIVIGVIVIIIAIPKEWWIAFGVIALITLVVWLIRKSSETDGPAEDREVLGLRVELSVEPSPSRTPVVTPRGPVVPPRWIPNGQMIDVAGVQIPGGMLYFGSGLKAPTGETEPALIDPRHPIAKRASDVAERKMDYWPSYAAISDSARRSYLEWLRTGRRDPRADAGYVFLFFYGLERRVLVDGPAGEVSPEEFALIEAEVQRLLSLYDGSRSFRRYASSFLDYLAARRMTRAMDMSEPPQVRNGDLSLGMRIALGRMALTGCPVPADWAFAWMRADPRISFPKALERCPDEFEMLFVNLYRAQHGDGLKLPVNRTRLGLTYRAASGGLVGAEHPFPTADVPDITAVIAPAKKIDAIVEECAAALAPYSRYVAKNPAKKGSLDAILLLPQSLWPHTASSTMRSLNERIGDGLRVMPLGELTSALGGATTLTRDRLRALAHALQELHIGMEPDVLAGARTPKVDDQVTLFRMAPEDGVLRQSPVYQAASVSLDLACSVAMADGKPHPNELRLLMKQIDGWAQLTDSQRKRLRARLRMAIDSPPSLASLRAKLLLIPAGGRRALAHLMSTLARADGKVEPSEVKLLEKVYKALELDAQSVYGDLHADVPKLRVSMRVTANVKTQEARQPPEADSLSLDMARIEALQRETEEVSTLLAKVFTDEMPAAAVEIQEEGAEIQPAGETTLLALDPEHTGFLQLLMTRSSWRRQDLADAAADMELMLDGALERINEAAFAQFDEPLLEGEDPVEVSRELLEKVPA